MSEKPDPTINMTQRLLVIAETLNVNSQLTKVFKSET